MTAPSMRAKYVAHEALFARERLEEQGRQNITDIDVEEFVEAFALKHIELAILQERERCAKVINDIGLSVSDYAAILALLS